MEAEQLAEFLNWMLECGIITSQEYIELQTKCLPFLQG